MMRIPTKITIPRRSIFAYIYYALLLLILFVCFHFNNVTIASIKISELFMLVMIPIILLYIKSVNKYIVLLGVFFLLLILTTVVKNIEQEFYYDGLSVSIIKQPYFISFTRFVEYLCCLAFSVYCYKALQYVERHKFSTDRLLLLFLWINALFSLLFIILYLADALQLLNAERTRFFYHGMRLRGFYDEGGPFGLMYATLFCLGMLMPGKNIVLKLLLGITVLLAESKAGILMMILWIAYTVYERLPKRGLIKPTALVIGSGILIFIGAIVADNYILIISNIQREVMLRPTDGNLVMGRISGFFITPEMVAHNPLIGVGMGNYSLVRNNPEYLGFFPPVQGWDLSGLGGLITLMAESGILGFLGFLALITALCRKLSNHVTVAYRNKLFLLFILPFVLGVQLYFIYVWFGIGYILYLSTKYTQVSSLPNQPNS